MTHLKTHLECGMFNHMPIFYVKKYSKTDSNMCSHNDAIVWLSVSSEGQGVV